MATREYLEIETGLHDIEYLGDGAYAGHDGWQMVTFTHDGYRVLNRIAFPPDGTFERLKRYGDRLEMRRGTSCWFDSPEDADAQDFPLHAVIGVRSHSAGMLFYKLMEAEDGQRFWRLIEETE